MTPAAATSPPATSTSRSSRVAKGATAVSVLKGLLAKNDDQAAHNREHFDRRGILAINLMSSPGSGKTALLGSHASPR